MSGAPLPAAVEAVLTNWRTVTAMLTASNPCYRPSARTEALLRLPTQGVAATAAELRDLAVSERAECARLEREARQFEELARQARERAAGAADTAHANEFMAAWLEREASKETS